MDRSIQERLGVLGLGRDRLALNSRKAIESDLRYLAVWARLSGLPDELPWTTEAAARFVVKHLADALEPHVERGLVRAGLKRPGKHAPTTVKRRLASLSVAHIEAGLPNPCHDPAVRLLMSRGHRGALHDGWSPRRTAAAQGDVLERILETCGEDLAGIRDRAVILFGVFSGGRRNSEVHSAAVERLVRVRSDYEYRLGPTKGVGRAETGLVPIYGRCAVALDAWLEASKVVSGPIFRSIDQWGHVSRKASSGEGVRLIVKRRAGLAGYDPARFGGRSLRSGFVTQAVRAGVPLQELMGLSFHRSIAGASIYYEPGAGLENMAARLSR